MQELIVKAEDLIKEISFLQGQKTTLLQEKEVIYLKVKEAKEWLVKQPEYEAFLKELQYFLQQENIGKFSEILTSLVQEILKKESKSISLNLDIQRNLPSLRIEALNGNNKEDIYTGNGGSILNIVATGLRLIALHRLGQRRFIILDEPDCWLEVEHVPTFAKIIGQLSSILKIQTIIISHHPYHFFKDYGRVIELKKENNQLYTNIIHDTPIEESNNKDIIKSITLRRFMSHYDTTYMLHPHLTCIVGANDIGKSVISAAMKAVAYNQSADNYIMHHENEAQVIIEFADEHSILWQRFRVTNSENPQKVKYTLFKNNIPLVEPEYNSSDTPVFITKKLDIVAIDDIDVHIGNQKEPAFVLSPNIKASQRAKILSLGQEAIYIQRMLEQVKTLTRENRQIEKEGESRYKIIDNQLSLLHNIEEQLIKAEKLKFQIKEITYKQEQLKQADEFIVNYFKTKEISSLPKLNIEQQIVPIVNFEEQYMISHKLNIFQKISQLDLINTNYSSIGIKDYSETEHFAINLKKCHKISLIPLIKTIDKFSPLENYEPLLNFNKNLILYFNISNIKKINTNVEIANIFDSKQIEQIAKNLKKLSNIKDLNLVRLDVNFSPIDTTDRISIMNDLVHREKEIREFFGRQQKMKIQYNTTLKEIEDFKKIFKNCPLCHQEIKHIHK